MSLYHFISLSISTSILSILIIYINNKLGNKFTDNAIGVQKFHSSPTPRLGGLSIFLTVFISAFFVLEYKQILFFILLSSLPTFISGFLEDLFGNVKPRQRLFGAFISGLLFIYLTGFYVKSVEIQLIDYALSIYFISFMFTGFAISGICNSINIIDGFNGLATGSLLIMFSTFAIIGWDVSDNLVINISLISIFIIIGFMVINFPLGYIFLGDAGAYFCGFLLAIVAIMLPFRNDEISSWVSLLVCIYPITETIFSIYRKVKRKGHHPSKPDGVHLHMLIYRNLSLKVSRKLGLENYRNPITSVIVWNLPLSSCIMALFTYQNQYLTYLMIFSMVVIYILIYKKFSLNW